MARFLSRRLTLLAGLLAVGAVIGAYLGDCMPGVGTGGAGDAPAAEAPTAEPKAQPKPKPKPPVKGASGVLHVTVEGDKCRTSGATTACSELCTRKAAVKRVDVDATLGSHRTVDELRACLEAAGYDDVVIRSD